MRAPAIGVLAVVLCVIGLILLKSALFVVDETEQAVIVRLGRPVHVIAGERDDEAWARILNAVTEEEKRSAISRLSEKGDHIHFHTFTQDSYFKLLEYFVNELEPSMDIEIFIDSERALEAIAVLSLS